MSTRLLALLVFAILGAAARGSVAQEAPEPAPDSRSVVREPSPEAADPASPETLSADKLFLEGRALIRQGKPQQACPMLERSHRLQPTLATLLNLGLCHRYSGHLATAHEYYRQAEVKATLENDSKRRDFAHEEAASLSTLRASLTLRISGNPDATLAVRIDDVVQPREVWERPMFIDAGEHRISVDAGANQSWQGSVQVVDGNKHLVVIPEFKPQGAPPPAAPEPKIPTALPAPIPAPAPPQEVASGPSALRVVAVSTAGAGLAALGVSLVYTILASNTYEDSKDQCNPANVCTPTGVDLRERARAHATRATVFGISGAVALAGGVAMWFLSAPEKRPESPNTVSFAVSPDSIQTVWTRSL